MSTPTLYRTCHYALLYIVVALHSTLSTLCYNSCNTPCATKICTYVIFVWVIGSTAPGNSLLIKKFIF